MTDWLMQSDGGVSRILSKRLGAYLQRQGSEKEIARLVGCDQRTARSLRSGDAWPNGRHMLGLWLAFGEDVLEAVFHPERAAQRLKFEEETRDAARKGRLAALSVEPDLRSFAPGGSQADRRLQDRTAAVTAD